MPLAQRWCAKHEFAYSVALHTEIDVCVTVNRFSTTM